MDYIKLLERLEFVYLNLKKKINSQSGFSILEAIVAAVIFVLGLSAVYAMVNFANKSLMSSRERDRLNMMSSEIMENLNLAMETYKNKGKNSEEFKDDFNNLDCYQDVTNDSSIKDKHRKRWKEKLGKKEASEECNLKIEKISGKEAYLVTIIIKRRNGKEIKIVKRLNEHK